MTADYPPDVSLRITVRTNGNIPPVLFALRNERGQGMNWVGTGLEANTPAVIAEMYAMYRELRSMPPGPAPYVDIPAAWELFNPSRTKRTKGPKSEPAPLFAGVEQPANAGEGTKQ